MMVKKNPSPVKVIVTSMIDIMTWTITSSMMVSWMIAVTTMAYMVWALEEEALEMISMA